MYQSSKIKFQARAILVIVILFFALVHFNCRNTGDKSDTVNLEEHSDQVNNTDIYPDNIKFRSFQNTDSTWGFTIFMNSRPYFHYKKVPLPKAVTGFETKEEADKVAELFVREIREGVLIPKFNIKQLDSLGIKLKY